MKARGLTLVEVLVSAVILAAAAGALASVARDASAAAREARDCEAALEALERWREDVTSGVAQLDAWRWVKESGGGAGGASEWRVVQEPIESAAGDPVTWVRLRVERSEPRGGFTSVLTVFRIPPPRETRRANPEATP